MDEALIRQLEARVRQPNPVPVKKENWRKNIKGVNGIDPMAPYVLPDSNTVYQNIVEVMNHKGYRARYTQNYTPIPAYFRKFGITPYFNPDDGSDCWAEGIITVAGMVELTNNGEYFQLLRDQDFKEVITIAQTYFNASIKLADTNPQLRAYLNRVHKFLQEAEKAHIRMLKRTGQYDSSGQLDILSILKKLFARGG